MPTYQSFTWYNVLDLLETAKSYGESEGFFIDDVQDIHKIEVKYSEKKQFSIVINEIDIGEDFNLSESWNIIKNCIEDISNVE